jgi:hypothetical protein
MDFALPARLAGTFSKLSFQQIQDTIIWRGSKFLNTPFFVKRMMNQLFHHNINQFTGDVNDFNYLFTFNKRFDLFQPHRHFFGVIFTDGY